MFNVAASYMNGELFPSDYKKGIDVCEKIANLSATIKDEFNKRIKNWLVIDAQQALSSYFERGKLVPRDLERAIYGMIKLLLMGVVGQHVISDFFICVNLNSQI